MKASNISPSAVAIMETYYANTPNKEIAEMIGCCEMTIFRMGVALELEKSKEHLSAIRVLARKKREANRGKRKFRACEITQVPSIPSWADGLAAMKQTK